jgi:hypothetical protein
MHHKQTLHPKPVLPSLRLTEFNTTNFQMSQVHVKIRTCLTAVYTS